MSKRTAVINFLNIPSLSIAIEDEHVPARRHNGYLIYKPPLNLDTIEREKPILRGLGPY